jgi:hypothetical protein
MVIWDVDDSGVKRQIEASKTINYLDVLIK